MGFTFVRTDDLARNIVSRDFIGEEFGGVPACVILLDAPPGNGPRLHRLSPRFVTEWLA